MKEDEINIIRFPALQKKLDGISRSTVDRWEKSQSFPARLHLGRNSIGWNLALVEQWLHDRLNSKQEI